MSETNEAAAEAPAGTPAPAATPAPNDPLIPGGREAAASRDAPAAAAYEFTAPEGVTLDAGLMQKFGDIARQQNLTPETAQALVSRMSPLMQQQMHDAQRQQHEGWLEASRNDAEFGGENLQQNLALAGRALERFGTPQLRAFLGQSRLGNHPELVRWAVRVGRAISPDGFASGSSSPARAPNDARSFYPNSNHS